MWIASLEAVRQAPLFGHGALSLRPIIEDRFHFEHNHNQYLAWLVNRVSCLPRDRPAIPVHPPFWFPAGSQRLTGR